MSKLEATFELSSLASQCSALGFCVARGLLEPAEVREIRDTFMEMGRNGPVEGLSEVPRVKLDDGMEGYSRNDPLAFYPRMMHPHRHVDKPVGPVARKYMLHARLRPILRILLNDEPLAVQSMFYFKPPGARGQDLHQDNFYLRVNPGTCVAAWMAIDDVDQENGGMVAVASTHCMDIACPEKSDSSQFFTTEHVEPPPGSQIVPIDMKGGDVLFFNGSVIHGSYPNRSNRFRRSLICHYVPLRSQELAPWYVDPVTFDGEIRSIPAAKGGGPCGHFTDAGVPH
jgi:ectoine hydroxylase-related dioxygenase (phytanoyl-CoA dioxygenase family)